MSRKIELKIIETLENNKDVPLSNKEILQTLEKNYSIISNRQTVHRILNHYEIEHRQLLWISERSGYSENDKKTTQIYLWCPSKN